MPVDRWPEPERAGSRAGTRRAEAGAGPESGRARVCVAGSRASLTNFDPLPFGVRSGGTTSSAGWLAEQAGRFGCAGWHRSPDAGDARRARAHGRGGEPLLGAEASRCTGSCRRRAVLVLAGRGPIDRPVIKDIRPKCVRPRDHVANSRACWNGLPIRFHPVSDPAGQRDSPPRRPDPVSLRRFAATQSPETGAVPQQFVCPASS